MRLFQIQIRRCVAKPWDLQLPVHNFLQLSCNGLLVLGTRGHDNFTSPPSCDLSLLAAGLHGLAAGGYHYRDIETSQLSAKGAAVHCISPMALLGVKLLAERGAGGAFF